MYDATRSSASSPRPSLRRRCVARRPRRSGAGRQDRRPDVGRHDRQPRLERHRVHGHQDQEDRRAASFLGNNVNPHMVMMSPDGRYVVTGGTRANKAYIIDAQTLQLVKVIPVDIAPEHLAFSPDSRWYYQGNPEGDSISVIDMQSLTQDQDDSRLRRAAQRHLPRRTARRPMSATTARTGSASSTSGATNC